jgi:hypothetical protein
MLQAFFLFAACSLVFVIVSLVTPPPDAARVGQYCWEKPWEAVTGTSITGPLDPRILAVVLVLVMVVLYGVFA